MKWNSFLLLIAVLFSGLPSLLASPENEFRFPAGIIGQLTYALRENGEEENWQRIETITIEEPIMSASIRQLVNKEHAGSHDGYINAFSDDPTIAVMQWSFRDDYEWPKLDSVFVEVQRPSGVIENHTIRSPGGANGEMKISLIPPERGDTEPPLPEEGLYHWKAEADFGGSLVEMGSGTFEVNYTAANITTSTTVNLIRDDPTTVRIYFFSDMRLISAEFDNRSNDVFACSVDPKNDRVVVCEGQITAHQVITLSGAVIVANYAGNISRFNFFGTESSFTGSTHIGYGPESQLQNADSPSSSAEEIIPCFDYNGIPGRALFEVYRDGSPIISYNVFASYSKTIDSDGFPAVKIESIRPMYQSRFVEGIVFDGDWAIDAGSGDYSKTFVTGWWELRLVRPSISWDFSAEINVGIPYLKFRGGAKDGASFSKDMPPFTRIIGGSIKVDAPSGQCQLQTYY